MTRYYKGKTTFFELMNMPLSYIHTLCRIAERQLKTEEGQKAAEAEAIQDKLEEAVT